MHCLRYDRRQVARLAGALEQGDPLADALVVDLANFGRPRREALEAGLKEGSATLSTELSPPLSAFLRHFEDRPAWLETRALTAAPVAYLSVPPLWFDLAMVVSVMHTYSSPAIARLLVRTGRLTNVAARRLDETSLWMNTVMQPGALLPGGAGYIAIA